MKTECLGASIPLASHLYQPSFLLPVLSLDLDLDLGMSFNQAIFLSSPSGLGSTLRDGRKKICSMNSIQGRGVGKGLRSLEVHGRRYDFQWRSRCISQEISAVVNDLNRTDGPTIHQKAQNDYHISAANEHAIEAGPKADHSDDLWTAAVKKLNTFYRFSRPYSVVNIVAAILSVSLLPVEHLADLSPLFFVGVLKALIPAVFMHLYVVAVNQVFDVEIDKVNKPSLPLASGELSVEAGAIITAAFATMSFFLGLKFGSPPVLCALLIWFLLGSAYSINLPFLRWKQNPFLAGVFSVGILGMLLQIPFFMHIQKYVLGRPVVLSKSVVFATAFMSLFSTVINFIKDIPDIEGDKKAGIKNLSVLLGPERVFSIGTKVLLAAYGMAMLVGATSSNIYWSIISVLGHGLLASILWSHARSVDIQNKASTQAFYIFVWKLFSAEYLLIPFIR